MVVKSEEKTPSVCEDADTSPGSPGEAVSVVDQSAGRKSHAVFFDGAGMPGVSGEENVYGPPMSALCANEPGVGADASLPGSNAPWIGSMKSVPSIAGPLWTVRRDARMSLAVLNFMVSEVALPAGEVIERWSGVDFG